MIDLSNIGTSREWLKAREEAIMEKQYIAHVIADSDLPRRLHLNYYPGGVATMDKLPPQFDAALRAAGREPRMPFVIAFTWAWWFLIGWICRGL